MNTKTRMLDELDYAEYLSSTERGYQVEHVTCLDCELYGIPSDDFTEDKSGEVCNDCWLSRQSEERGGK